ncbi:hypothetical protein EDD29_0075 [Actinocorallia herbida]|uniref:Uncharacterized protein n=1 Tax=Actinocorallia herbida TaxID=58109 RepID=A0A3N1CN69_9ACTN|nr:hypothetical protein [Actinocorallia herbida]ROO82594.1 hypothetical protein EDD29_0075 [Actinocorallia herbida]
MTDPTTPPGSTTKPRQFRVSDPIWTAYERVCQRLGATRAEDLNAHIAAMIREHGDPQDIADLEAGLSETAHRRSRMHPGRPPKAKPDS